MSFALINFIYRKYQYFKDAAAKSPIPQEFESILHTLERDGIVVIEDFIEKEAICKMLEEIAVIEQQLQATNRDLADEKVWRIPRIDEKVSETKNFFNHDLLGAIAAAYVGIGAYCSRRVFANKYFSNSWRDGATEFFHFDDWKLRLKAMLYLTDTGPLNSPFSYVVGSHKSGLWKFAMEFDFFKNFDRSVSDNGNDKWEGCFFDHQIRKLMQKKKFSERVVTAPAGSLIIFDSRGIHRGYPLKRGFRKILMAHWKLPGGDGELKAGNADAVFG